MNEYAVAIWRKIKGRWTFVAIFKFNSLYARDRYDSACAILAEYDYDNPQHVYRVAFIEKLDTRPTILHNSGVHRLASLDERVSEFADDRADYARQQNWLFQQTA